MLGLCFEEREDLAMGEETRVSRWDRTTGSCVSGFES